LALHEVGAVVGASGVVIGLAAGTWLAAPSAISTSTSGFRSCSSPFPPG
jgi:hypothetical protein